jgi:hypothetical protein
MSPVITEKVTLGRHAIGVGFVVAKRIEAISNNRFQSSYTKSESTLKVARIVSAMPSARKVPVLIAEFILISLGQAQSHRVIASKTVHLNSQKEVILHHNEMSPYLFLKNKILINLGCSRNQRIREKIHLNHVVYHYSCLNTYQMPSRWRDFAKTTDGSTENSNLCSDQ